MGRTCAALSGLECERELSQPNRIAAGPDGALWIITSNTDRATWGGTAPRPGDDRILRMEVS